MVACDGFFNAKAPRRQGREVDEDALASVVVDAALAVHRGLGPGLLESAYRAALGIELAERGLPFETECPIQGSYRGRPLGIVYRADLGGGGRVRVEMKSVERLEPVHAAQLLSYLRLSCLKLGLLINFNAPLLKQGLRRIVNDL